MGLIIDKQYRAAIFRDWSYIAHFLSFVDVSRSAKFLCLLYAIIGFSVNISLQTSSWFNICQCLIMHCFSLLMHGLQGRIQGGGRGHTRRTPPLKLEKIWFFCIKSWFFTRNTPRFFKWAIPPPTKLEILDPHLDCICLTKLKEFPCFVLFCFY